MGLFSSLFGSKQKTDSSSTQTTTPNIPDWIQTPIQGQLGAITDLANSDPYQWVAPASDLQNQAFAGANYLSDQTGIYGDAMEMMARAANNPAPTYTAATGTASSLLDGLQNYMSPYKQNVVDGAVSDWDVNAGQQRAQADLDLAASGAFGGSGAGIAKSQLNDNLARGRQSTVAGLYDQMFNTGAGLSSDDAGRRQQQGIANMDAQNTARSDNARSWNETLNRQLSAANNLASTAGMFSSNQRANLGTLSDLGGIQRGITQEQTSAPISLLGTTTGLSAGLPLNMFAGQTTTGKGTQSTVSTPSVMQAVGQAAQIAAMFSDERLKTDIEFEGELANGLGVYSYRYIWGGPRQRGVMAQEVQTIQPEAVVEDENGYLKVDYGQIGAF